MADLLLGLTEVQREAVTSAEGIIRVIAGTAPAKPGTRSHRFAFLVNKLGILPGDILNAMSPLLIWVMLIF